MRLVAPLLLLVLAPFVGEYLLGNLPPDAATRLLGLPPLMLLYGAGAILVREAARRLGRGYPTMVAFAIAYGLLEEGIVLGTLFNRDYLGMGLLEHGWIAELGTSLAWSTYVVGIHSAWSIVVPIVLVEHLLPRVGREPWLRVPGTIGVAALFIAGAAFLWFVTMLQYGGFVPSAGQLLAVAALALAAIAAGMLLPRRARSGRAPHPLVVGVATLVASSLFVAVRAWGADGGLLPPLATVVAQLAIAAAAFGGLLLASLRDGWSTRHTLAATAGALGTYAWFGFLVQLTSYPMTVAGVVSQVAFVVVAVALVVVAWRRGARGAVLVAA